MGSNELMDVKDAIKVSVLNVWKNLLWIMADVNDVIYQIKSSQNIKFSKLDAHSVKMEPQISVAIVTKALLILQILRIKINKSILLIQVLIQQIDFWKSVD